MTPQVLQKQRRENDGVLKIRFLFNMKLDKPSFVQFCKTIPELCTIPYKGWDGTVDYHGFDNLWVYIRETY